MQPDNFCCWLQGFLGIGGKDFLGVGSDEKTSISDEQLLLLKQQLALVQGIKQPTARSAE